MKKKIIPVLVAIVLIFIVLAIAIGSQMLGKYSYSKVYADLNQYFEVNGQDEVAIVLQDEILPEKAKLIGETYYFDYDTVITYFTDRFYLNDVENVLQFTNATDVLTVHIGDDSNICYVSGNEEALEYKAAVYDGETLYIASDYVRKFSNFSYETFKTPNRMQVYTEWNSRSTAEIRKKTAIRYQGGVKSDILQDLQPGDTVYVLEQLENWSKIKTQNALIGYVENKYLTNDQVEESDPVDDAMVVEIPSIQRDHKINLGFHQVFNTSVDLSGIGSGSSTLNTIAPTWFRISDNEGGFESLANHEYVDAAHARNLEVWAVLTDVDSKDLYGLDVDLKAVFSSTENRNKMIQNLISQAVEYDVDGINIDLESVSKDAGKHFVQFIRELSIQTRANNIVLSVDNYVPTEYTAFYNRKEQGLFADYLIIMGYDEHYAGNGEAGSVASINYVESGIENTKKSVPAEKIINAIPFYTRVWDNSSGSVYGSTLTMRAQADWVAQSGVEPSWNEETCQNYVEYDKDGVTYQCWLEDAESIAVKLSVMQTQEIAGVAEWKLGIEDPAIWDEIDQYMNQ